MLLPRIIGLFRSGNFLQKIKPSKWLKPQITNFIFHSHSYTSQNTHQVTGQLLLGFTCNVCETRSHRTMSRQAYTKGVVLVECPGCRNRHLIADHLGWFEHGKGTATRTIEELLALRGETVRKAWKTDEHGAILECLANEKSVIISEDK